MGWVNLETRMDGGIRFSRPGAFLGIHEKVRFGLLEI